ncbi:MAG: hypothetical protein JRC53_00010 [Deltaproteobacteria bacterium]|nr:hypothetical protein [Deltaproteobacteria bacterium]
MTAERKVKMIAISHAAAMVGTKPSTMRRWLKNNEIKTTEIEGKVCFSETDMIGYFEEHYEELARKVFRK